MDENLVLMSDTIQLDQYLQRIGYSGPVKADLPTLQKIQELHPSVIPFENLNPFTGAPVKLSLPAIEEKLVRRQRGGYCFEQNKLLMAALLQIGFQVRGLAARVISKQSIDAVTPLTHMLLLIELDGISYISDVGFGGMSPTSPLLIQTDIVQTTPHEPYRLVDQGNYYRLEAKVKEAWKPLYKFHLEEHFEADYEVMNWYTSCHPSSHFTNTLIAARAVPGGRFALRNLQLSRHYLDQDSEQTELKSRQEVIEVLQDIFLLDISPLEKLQKQIDQLFDK